MDMFIFGPCLYGFRVGSEEQRRKCHPFSSCHPRSSLDLVHGVRAGVKSSAPNRL